MPALFPMQPFADRGANRSAFRTFLSLATLVALLAAAAQAKVELPNVFTDHMVLQRDQKNKVWGKGAPQEKVMVTIAGQQHSAIADANGAWHVFIDPLPAGGPHELAVSGSNKITIQDVLVGEVWICSGQSNMQWSVNQSNDADLERQAARHAHIRMINFPQVGSQEAIWTHDRAWQVCTPENAGGFSAVGYYFGRQLHETLGIPIGMINNAWGGSACEAWINRSALAADAHFAPLLARWSTMEKQVAELSARTNLSSDEQNQLNELQGQMGGNSRPGNIYNGVLKSHLGYGIRGAIWYQGESNVSRAYQYRDLFPLMISSWRKDWGQGDFPFYWVQLADFRDEQSEPVESDWAELREAQTMTMSKLKRTGEAVIIDIGEGKDIHPMNKVDVGRRLARWALANDYGHDVAFRSPQYKSMERQGADMVLTFDHVGDGWRPFDVQVLRGFAIAGADRKFVWANARIVDGNRIAVSSDKTPVPVSVRYAWADNPICNVYNQAGLPLTPFRTDDWPGITANAK